MSVPETYQKGLFKETVGEGVAVVGSSKLDSQRERLEMLRWRNS